jgi:deoxyadenosine/deoxycytidine kinase
MAYAEVNLAGNRLKIFFEIVTELQKELGLPSKIIHLVCPEEVLLKRIIRRSREAETSITIEYLNSLNKAILLRAKDFSSQIPVITINSHVINFTQGIENIHEVESILP